MFRAPRGAAAALRLLSLLGGLSPALAALPQLLEYLWIYAAASWRRGP
ncbi:hypothetical protein [Janthinobacterium sp.]|nr:hypothetical protein [Janthinobacterium sp.]